MTHEQWTTWIALLVGFAAGLVIHLVLRLEWRRNLALHLDASTDVLHLMAEHGATTVPIKGALDAFESIRQDVL